MVKWKPECDFEKWYGFLSISSFVAGFIVFSFVSLTRVLYPYGHGVWLDGIVALSALLLVGGVPVVQAALDDMISMAVLESYWMFTFAIVACAIIDLFTSYSYFDASVSSTVELIVIEIVVLGLCLGGHLLFVYSLDKLVPPRSRRLI